MTLTVLIYALQLALVCDFASPLRQLASLHFSRNVQKRKGARRSGSRAAFVANTGIMMTRCNNYYG
jgi:hypothetical protein